MSTKTHWKKLGKSDYLGAWSLYDNEGKPFDLVVKCLKVEMKEITGEGGRKEDARVMTLEKQLPLIINNTNAKSLQALFGTPMIEDWAGRLFTLYVTQVKVKGEWTDCLRIRKEAPKAQPMQLVALTPQHPDWSKVVQGVKSGQDINYLRQYFSVTDATFKQLQNEAVQG